MFRSRLQTVYIEYRTDLEGVAAEKSIKPVCRVSTTGAGSGLDACHGICGVPLY